MAVTGDSAITFIQGDSYTKKLTITGVPEDTIDGVYITSAALEINKKLTVEGDKFVFHLTPAETQQMKLTVGNYDITIKFKDSNVLTVQYNAPIKVLPKSNKVEDIGG